MTGQAARGRPAPALLQPPGPLTVGSLPYGATSARFDNAVVPQVAELICHQLLTLDQQCGHRRHAGASG